MRRCVVLLGLLGTLSCGQRRRAEPTIARDVPVDAGPAHSAKLPPFAPRAARTTKSIRPAPRPDMEPLLAALRKDGGVGGAAVGAGGTESTFHRATRELLPHADDAVVRWLLDDDYPNVRALGFVAAAARGNTAALIEHVCERDRVEFCPGGCVCFRPTVGALAQQQLWSPGAFVEIGDSAVPPSFGSAEKNELALRLAAIDGCDLAAEATATLKELTGRGWKWIATKAAPTVPTWLIVKAIARIERADALPLLISALEDGSLPSRTRLTAASALTLSSTLEAEVAIERHAKFLDAARAGLSSELIDTIRMRRDAEALVAPINEVHTWMETEKLASNAVAAYKFRHPLIVGLVPAVSYGARDSDVHAARRTALMWTAEHLTAHEACWDVYREITYELDWMVDNEFWRMMNAYISPAEQATLAAHVHAVAARLDRDTSCLE